jgi:hypothetical protein
MKLTVHLEGKTKADLAKGLKAHLALFQNDEETDAIDVSSLGKKGKKKPLKTVDADEDEDFGSEPLDEEDLDDGEDDEEEEDAPTKRAGKSGPVRSGKKQSKKVDTEQTEETDDEEDEEGSEGDDEADEPSVSFQDVRAALNKYGEKHPDQARAILSTFNIKSPKELSAKHNEKYWEPVYRKVMAKIKAAKKRK